MNYEAQITYDPPKRFRYRPGSGEINIDLTSRIFKSFHVDVFDTDEPGSPIVAFGKFTVINYNASHDLLEQWMVKGPLTHYGYIILSEFAADEFDERWRADRDESPGCYTRSGVLAETIYVEPEYRGLGAGSFLLDNIDNFVYEAFDTLTSVIVIRAVPAIYINQKFRSISEDEEELKLLTDFLESRGFEPYKEPIYVKECYDAPALSIY